MTNTPDGVIKLEIAQAQPSDCGAYKLVISNPNGESAALCAVAVKRMYQNDLMLLLGENPNQILSMADFDCLFQIAEPMAPVFVKPLNDLKVVIGQPLNLEAQISAFPSPEVKWFKDGTQLRPSQAFNFVNQPNGVIGLK